MTDPTKQAATAKTAREVIREAQADIEKYLGGVRIAQDLVRLEDSRAGLGRACLALRALLAAPEGGVQRLDVSAEALWSEVLDLLDFTQGKTFGVAPRLVEILGDLATKATAVQSALAALRASPESVGGAVSPDIERLLAAERVRTADALRERDTFRDNLAWTSKQLDESRGLGYLTRAEKAEKERDALKAELDAAWATTGVEGMVRGMATLADVVGEDRKNLKANLASEKAAHERDRGLSAMERAAHEKTNADLAAARGEVERVKADPRLTLRWGVKDPERKMLAAFLDHDEARAYWDPIRNSTFVTFGPDAVMGRDFDKSRGATPTPATEAPISERAKWIADAVLRCESAREVLGSATEKDEERVVVEWTRCIGRLLAASERVAKGEGGA